MLPRPLICILQWLSCCRIRIVCPLGPSRRPLLVPPRISPCVVETKNQHVHCECDEYCTSQAAVIAKDVCARQRKQLPITLNPLVHEKIMHGNRNLTDDDCPMHSSGINTCTICEHLKYTLHESCSFHGSTLYCVRTKRQEIVLQKMKSGTLSTALTMPVPVSSSESSTVVMPSPCKYGRNAASQSRNNAISLRLAHGAGSAPIKCSIEG